MPKTKPRKWHRLPASCNQVIQQHSPEHKKFKSRYTGVFMAPF